MKSNISGKNTNFMSNPVCITGSFLYFHLTKGERFYLTLCAESQCLLILITNILTLV